MNEPVIRALVSRAPGGNVQVLSPAVGWWSDHPAPGSLVAPGSRVGLLSRLNDRFVLSMPDDVTGRVVAQGRGDLTLPVEFEQVLFEVAPLDVTTADASRESGAAPGGDPHLPEGARPVVAPTDGVFYRRPSPGARPFVEVGDRVHSGQPVGIVEVMKTFNQILYGAAGLPEQAEVVEVRAEDGEEVRAGQILIVVR